MEATPSSAAAGSAALEVLGRDGQLLRPPPRPTGFVDVVAIITSTVHPWWLGARALRLTCKAALLALDGAWEVTKVAANKVPTGQQGAADLARFCRRLPNGPPTKLWLTSTTMVSDAAEAPEEHL